MWAWLKNFIPLLLFSLIFRITSSRGGKFVLNQYYLLLYYLYFENLSIASISHPEFDSIPNMSLSRTSPYLKHLTIPNISLSQTSPRKHTTLFQCP